MPALLDLVPLAALVVAVALTLLCIALVKGLMGPLTTLPAVGSAIGKLEDLIVHALMSAMGAAIHGTEKLVGASFHELARLLDWAWREFRAHANLIAAIATPIGLLLHAYHAIKALVNRAVHVAHGTVARFKPITRELHHLAVRLHHLEHEVRVGIGHDVLPRIKALDREIAHVEDSVIPSIREAEREAAAAIDNLYEWAKGKASLLGVGTFAFAVAAVLDTLGLGAIRCPTLGNVFSRRGCGLWNLLDDVLGLLADAIIFFDLCQVIPTVTTLFAEVEAPLTALISDAANAVCANQTEPGGSLPEKLLYLPANPGIVLNLP